MPLANPSFAKRTFVSQAHSCANGRFPPVHLLMKHFVPRVLLHFGELLISLEGSDFFGDNDVCTTLTIANCSLIPCDVVIWKRPEIVAS